MLRAHGAPGANSLSYLFCSCTIYFLEWPKTSGVLPKWGTHPEWTGAVIAQWICIWVLYLGTCNVGQEGASYNELGLKTVVIRPSSNLGNDRF